MQSLCPQGSAYYEVNKGYINFGDGTCEITSSALTLTLQVNAETPESLVRLQRVVGDHLLRFTPEEDLKVEWGMPAQH